MQISKLPRLVVCAITAIMLSNLANGQEFPTRPIRLIAVSAPGGGSDTLARLFAPYLSKELGQSVIVDNQPGGAGAMAIRSISYSSPDGYTMFLTQSENAFGSLFTRDSADLDIEKRLAPISLLANSPLFLITNYNAPFNTLNELVAYAKANPGKLNFGAPGPTAITNLWMHSIRQKFGLDIVDIHYKSGGAATSNAIRVNELQLTFGGPRTAIASYKEKWGKPIAIGSKTRSPAFPDLPTFPELGLPEISGQIWMLYCRIGTSRDRIKMLNEAAVRVVKNPDVVKRLSDLGGYDPIGSNPEILAKEYAAMKVRIADIAQKAGIKPE